VDRILADLHVFVGMTEAINSNLDLRAVLQGVTDAGTKLSGAQFGAFFYTPTDSDGQMSRFHVLSGVDESVFAQVPPPRLSRIFEPARTGTGTIRVGDVLNDPRIESLPHGHLPVRSYLATSVMSRTGEIIGALMFGHDDPHAFDQRSEDVVRLVAAQASVAIENARLFAAEKSARKQAEEAVDRLALLQTITSRLANAFTSREALSAVVDTLSGPMGAHRIGVYLREDGVFRLVAGTGGGTGQPSGESSPMRLLRADWPSPAATAAATREPVILRSVEQIRGEYPELAMSLRGVEAGVCLPLTFGDNTLGVLVLAWPYPRAFPTREVEMLSAAAGQLASALERVRLYDAERAAQDRLADNAAQAIKVSQTLQRSLLPRSLPKVESVEVAVRYLPGTAGAEVGGDWYDLIAGPGGVGVLVVGDVQGHSIGAAAVMGQLRTALHAYLAEGHEPHVAVARVNRVMADLDAHVLVTCCLIALDPASGEAKIVRAGHPLPLLRRADGSVQAIAEEGGIPLGVLADEQWPTATVRLEAGDRLLLYTDGLVEHPGDDVTTGVVALMEATAAAGFGRADADADAILASLGTHRRDDVALMVCDYAGVPAGRRTATLTVEDVDAVSRARAFTRETLHKWRMAPLEETVTLLVSEMVTNALVHTDGFAELELRRDDSQVRILVTDAHSRVPRPREAALDATGGRGLMLVESLAEEWGVVPSGGG
jgi:serine phosphatase RsbU (regulator of sigma subunit)/anti-sigma regulatory factor (Ser/Thr protein kinase)